MLIRYKVNDQGKRIPIAKVYVQQEHNISRQMVDKDAVWIIKKLKDAGYEAYIVGGAVRDLLLGKAPKDFDISTAASPKMIRKIFWNSRIIGRRFKLVHIHFQEKIFEVSTFRSSEQGELGEHNIYGTIEEDAKRRDFTLNGLYYDPLEKQVVDFLDAFKDIQAKRVKSIIPLSITFIEDPVRMIRGIKYTVSSDFSMSWRLKMAIRKHAKELANCSSSRMTEEIFKILGTGYSVQIIKECIKFNLFHHMLPLIDQFISGSKNYQLVESFYDSLSKLDKRVKSHQQGEIPKSDMLAALIESLLIIPDEYENSQELFKDVFKQIKQLITPITPPNYEVEKAVAVFFTREGIKIPKNAVRKPTMPGQKKVQKSPKSVTSRKYPTKARKRPYHPQKNRKLQNNTASPTISRDMNFE